MQFGKHSKRPPHFAPTFLGVLSTIALLCASPRAHAQAASATELVRQAKAHEDAHDEATALRRYTDALSLDPTSGAAYLGLGALRVRMGDFREAERVYSVALEHNPSLVEALAERARARWNLGFHADAENDMDHYIRASGDRRALRELADWYGRDQLILAQLGIWRRIVDVTADDVAAPTLRKEPRTMIRALQILVGTADPVSSPILPDATRLAIAHIARHGTMTFRK